MKFNKQDLKILLNYYRLKDIKRCNNFPVINVDTVAQHSFYTAMLTMVLVDEYNTWATEHNLGFHPYDVENQYQLAKSEIAIRKALTHDLEEAFTSDIPWNIKHMDDSTHEVLVKAINAKLDKIYEKSCTMEIYKKLNQECKDGFEGQFVQVADMLELSIYCCLEVVKGNVFMKPMLDKSVTLIESFELYGRLYCASNLFQELMIMFKSDLSGFEKLISIE